MNTISMHFAYILHKGILICKFKEEFNYFFFIFKCFDLKNYDQYNLKGLKLN